MNKHNGINATREALKDQLVLAADEIIRMRTALDWMNQHASFGTWRIAVPGAGLPSLRHRLARWMRGLWS